MNLRSGLFALASTLILALSAQAQTITATCNDGSSYTGQTRQGACSRHGGVKEWTPAAVPAQTAPAAPVTTAPTTTAPQAAPATSGQVWVNTSTRVYHCSGDRWYGKTKKGAYMSEVDAKAKGNRPDHGKVCS